MREDLRDQFDEFPDIRSYTYAGFYLKSLKQPRKLPFPEALYRKYKDLWLPLHCTISIANSGAAHVVDGFLDGGTTTGIDSTGADFFIATISGDNLNSWTF